jgi:hypothetical protein
VHTVRRVGGLVLLVALEVGAVVALARLGQRPPFAVAWGALGDWLRSTDPADAVAALVRVAALAATAWLLAVTLACALLDLAAGPPGSGGRVHAQVRRVTPLSVQRVVDRALLVAVVGVAAVSPPAHAADPPHVRDGRVAPTTVVHAPAIAGSPTAGPTASAPIAPAATPAAIAATPPAAGISASPVSVTVAPGDDLWRLAAARLAAATNRPRATVADAEIARYWVAVCEANRAVVRSGDVNLVYPGEVLVLPAVTPPTR